MKHLVVIKITDISYFSNVLHCGIKQVAGQSLCISLLGLKMSSWRMDTNKMADNRLDRS